MLGKTPADQDWDVYKKRASHALARIHEGAWQAWAYLRENSGSDIEYQFVRDTYVNNFNSLVVDKVNELFDQLSFGLAERCLATIVLMHLYAAMVDALEGDDNAS